jgi:hypothetical protein
MLHSPGRTLRFCWLNVVMPKGQRVQNDAPETAKVAVTQSAQIALPNAPDAAPAGHGVQFQALRNGA